MQVTSTEIKGRSDRSSKSLGQDSFNPSILGSTQSGRSSLSKPRDSVVSSSSNNSAVLQPPSGPYSLNPPSFLAAPSDYSNAPSNRSGAPSDMIASSSATLKEGAKGGAKSGKEKKTDKPTIDCLNLVSKACFRKVPPSAFYLFFPPKSTKVEYTYSTASTDKEGPKPVTLPTEGTQKGILHSEKDPELAKETTQGKSVKLVGFGMGNDVQDQGKVKSDVSLGISMKSEQQSSPETQMKSKKLQEKVTTKSKKGPNELQKNLQGVSQETVEDSIFSAEPDKVVNVITPDKKKGKLTLKKRSPSSLVEDSTTEIMEKKTLKKKKKKDTSKSAKVKKPKTSAIAKEDKAVIVSGEAAGKGPDHNQEDLEADEHGLQQKHPENVLEATGSFMIEKTHDVDEAGIITEGSESEDDLIQVWKSGRILSTDQLVFSPATPLTEPAPVVIPSAARTSSGSLNSADSSSSSSSSDSAKSKKDNSQIAGKTDERATEAVTEPLQAPKLLQRGEPYQMVSGALASQSFVGGSEYGPTSSFMMPSEQLMMGRLPRRSLNSIPIEQPPELLQAVSSCTLQLLKTYNALVEDKSDEQWAPIKDLMSVMSYDELTRRRESELDEDIETNINEGKDENQEEEVLTSPVDVVEDSSSQTLGSNVIPSSDNSVLGQKQSKLMPNNFSEKEFMKYFCSDWEHPTSNAFTKSDPKNLVTRQEEVAKTVSEAIDQIEPNATYDVIFTYKMPKSSPFDLNDSLADVRFKCVQKWMNDTVNASYRAYFDSEIKGRTDEKMMKQLMEKMVSLQLKIREYEVLRQMEPVYSHPTESSKSSFLVDESFANKSEEEVEEDEGLEDSLEHPSDGHIDSEIGILMSKVEQLRPEDAEVKERRIIESMDASATDHVVSDKVSESCQSLCSSGSGSKRVTLETRGKRRRKEIKEQLEKVIGLLEQKLNRLKAKTEFQFEDYEQENEETDEFEPQTATKRSNFNQPDAQNPPKQDISIRDIEAKLRRDFLIGLGPKNKSKTFDVVSRGGSHGGSRKNVEFPSRRSRLQHYLLGVTDTWYQEEEEASIHE